MKPNILFIIVDDLTNDIGSLGSDVKIPTPNIDRLRQRGMSFTNAQNNCPICLPSRNSLFSGLHPVATGHYKLNDAVESIPAIRDAVMLPQHLRKGGYGIYGGGKIFHNGWGDKSWWDEYGRTRASYGPFYWDGSTKKPSEHPLQAHLLEGDEIFGEQGEFSDPELAPGEFTHSWEFGFGPLSNVPDNGWWWAEYPFRYASETDRELLPDEVTRAFAVDILGRDHDRPFFLGAGFVRPHTPLYAPKKYFDMFPLEDIKLPRILEGDLDDCAEALQWHRPYARLRWRTVMREGEAMWKQWLQAYYACTAFMDDQLGQVLDALDASPHRDNTVVVLTSDNGYHLGQKEWLFKDSPWNESARAPLIIAAPGLTAGGTRCDAPVSLLDLYPTLCDLCGLDADPHAATHGLPLQGHSLRPLLVDPSDRENAPPASLCSLRGMTGTHHSLLTRTHRYIRCESGEEELYDLSADPLEWHNLAGENPSVLRDLRSILDQEITRLEGTENP